MGESAWFKHRLPMKGEVDIVMCVLTYESKSLESFSSVDLSEAVTDAGIHARVSLSHKKDTVKKKLMISLPRSRATDGVCGSLALHLLYSPRLCT